MLKFQTHRGDGTSTEGETFEYIVRDPSTGEPLPDVVFTLLSISKLASRSFYQARTVRVSDPKTRGLVDQCDNQGAADDIVEYVLKGWTGVVGSDGKTLVCKAETRLALDDRYKAQICEAVMGAEVTTRGPSSFQKPADVPAVVGRLQPGDKLLRDVNAG